MYEPSLTVWHTDFIAWEYYRVNTPDLISLRWSWDDEDYLDKYLKFDYRPLSFYFINNKIRIWII